MLFGEKDDVVFPEGVGVVKGEDPFVLETDRDDLKAGEDLAAVEITDGFSHGLYFPLLPYLNALFCRQQAESRRY